MDNYNNYYQPQNNQNGTYYTPPQSESNQYQPRDNGYNYNSPNGNNGSPKPPKKSKAGVIILVILVVCIAVAVAGIVISVAGSKSLPNTNNNNESTTQAQNADDVAGVTDNKNDVPLTSDDDKYTVAGVAQKVVNSCVGITVYSQQADAYNYFYGYNQNDNNLNNQPSKSGEGSGVIMAEKNGKTYIITCAHVISDGDSFKVTLNNGTELDAQMVAFDSQTDIGVLSVDKTGLQVAEFANSDNLVLGEQVVAIGCPGGLEFMNSLTSGYISALSRPISSKIGYDNNCIQVDAAINPGNSGGALFNMSGQVIGINSSKIAATEYEGMGFAVPSTTAIATANSLIKSGYVEGRAKIGIQYNPLTSFNNASAIIQALDSKGYKDCQGAMVINSIDEGSSLKGKDIKQYDMIIAVNDKTLTSTDVMTSVLAESKPGDTVKLTIARIENNQIKTFTVDCKLIESKG